ncbi:hypothetical protein ANANG_G00056920 [Anguilla anguilla]|uniref:Uncharacterized protein n=1 Tax=Anguilla anguilla TaxID=7936 RepID=A0A9D3MQ27_ANGAN|nr:hypothetical protein ANANG_G00056920 [Anguilla anguilla]
MVRLLPVEPLALCQQCHVSTVILSTFSTSISKPCSSSTIFHTSADCLSLAVPRITICMYVGLRCSEGVMELGLDFYFCQPSVVCVQPNLNKAHYVQKYIHCHSPFSIWCFCLSDCY